MIKQYEIHESPCEGAGDGEDAGTLDVFFINTLLESVFCEQKTMEIMCQSMYSFMYSQLARLNIDAHTTTCDSISAQIHQRMCERVTDHELISFLSTRNYYALLGDISPEDNFVFVFAKCNFFVHVFLISFFAEPGSLGAYWSRLSSCFRYPKFARRQLMKDVCYLIGYYFTPDFGEMLTPDYIDGMKQACSDIVFLRANIDTQQLSASHTRSNGHTSKPSVNMDDDDNDDDDDDERIKDDHVSVAGSSVMSASVGGARSDTSYLSSVTSKSNRYCRVKHNSTPRLPLVDKLHAITVLTRSSAFDMTCLLDDIPDEPGSADYKHGAVNFYFKYENDLMSYVLSRVPHAFARGHALDLQKVRALAVLLPYIIENKIINVISHVLRKYCRMTEVYSDVSLCTIYGVCIYIQYCTETHLDMMLDDLQRYKRTKVIHRKPDFL